MPHQRTPPSGRGDAPERSKPRPSNRRASWPPRSRSMDQSRCRLQRTRPKRRRSRQDRQKRAHDQRGASRSATRPISNSWHRSRVWSAGEAPLMPTICGSPSPARWGARSATSSPSRCVERITATTIASEMSRLWWEQAAIDPIATRGCSGSRPGASNDRRKGNTP